MDLITLGIKLKSDPLTYRNEFVDELRSFEMLASLPSPPVKQIKPFLSFVIRNVHVDPESSIKCLYTALENIKDLKMRRTILAGLILVRQKKLIESKELFKRILTFGSDLRFYLKGCQEFLDVDCYGVLMEWYSKGTEKQKSFCYYFLLILFHRIGQNNKDIECVNDQTDNTKDHISDISDDAEDCVNDKVDDVDIPIVDPKFLKKNLYFDDHKKIIQLETVICEAFFGTNKISKICMLYFLNRTEIAFDISKLANGFEYARRIYKDLSENHMDRDVKIMKLRIFVQFKKHFKVKNSITNIILKMIDLEKEDLGELLDCLVNSVERSEANSVMKVLSEEFVHENKDDDIVCYGMNVMREIYYRLAGLEKNGALDLNEEYEEDSYVNGDSCENEDNVDDSDKKKFKSNVKDEDPFVTHLKEVILAYISIFRGNRTKSIHYAYKALIKAVVKNEAIDKPTTFILKSKTKEEREKLRLKNRDERKREVAKEQRERKMKKNRMGRLKNKKNRLLVPDRKKRVKKS